MRKTGARNFARKFYSSKQWEWRSKTYRNEHPLCEKCLAKGLYVPAVLVHHKVHISPENCHDPNILLGEDNLESLCAECHAEEHSDKEVPKFDEYGCLII
jgi:5-methylcytosine-specific restriction endonuclease McrA